MDSVAHAALVPAPRAPSDHRYDAPPFRARNARVGYGGDNAYGVMILTYPPASAVAEDVLSWLDDHECRAVLDPDGRAWLRYDPATGRYAPVQGTAEQVARVLVREAAQACQRYGGDGWRANVNLLTGEEPLHLGLLPVSGHQASIGEIAAAVVDIASGGERAAATRAQLKSGRRPDIVFNPKTWCPSAGGGFWSDPWEGCGVSLGGDGNAPYDSVPLKAAGYAPGYNDFLRPATAEEAERIRGAYARLAAEAAERIRAGRPTVADKLGHVPRVPADGEVITVPDCAVPATPMFGQLCKLVWPDPAVRNAALRALSMGFTGRATKYVIYWSSETGRGKSLMAAIMSDLLGDYAKAIPAKTLFGYSADPQRAAEELAGTRLAIVEEGIGDQSFKADAAFKLVTTGGGDLNARQLYRESRQVQATHTILLAVNPEAGMNYADPAIRARLCPVRFDGDPAAIARFAEAYNPSSAAWKAEAPAVLALMLEYARDFWSGDWKPWTMADIDAHAELAEVIDADLTLAIEMKTGNNVAAYIDANRRQLAGAPEGHGARDLYRGYLQWAALTGQDTVSETAFGRALGKCDEVTRTREAKGTVYRIAPPAGQ